MLRQRLLLELVVISICFYAAADDAKNMLVTNLTAVLETCFST